MKNETVADIVRELRGFRDEMPGEAITWPRQVIEEEFDDLADRIEAAEEREKAVTDALLACKDKMIPHPDPEHAPPPYPGNAAAMRLCDEFIQAAYDADICSPGDLAQRVRKIKDAIGPSPLGNAAKLRETLKTSRDYFVALREKVPGSLSEQYLTRRIADIDVALASPVRNCDVGTAEEQSERFTKVCVANSRCGARGLCSDTCPFNRDYRAECALVWAQKPYEKGSSE